MDTSTQTCRMLEGENLKVTPTGKSVSVSFRVRVVRAVRVGEAKLHVRVSGNGFCRWGLGWQDPLLLLLLLLLLRSGSREMTVSRALRIMDLCKAMSSGL